MPDFNGAPQIAAQGAKFANVDITPLAYADPEKFPHGMECVIFSPGVIQPLGRGPIPRGFMLALIGPDGARAFLAAVHQAAAMAPGQTKPPGM
jgi:hypothetical protein